MVGTPRRRLTWTTAATFIALVATSTASLAAGPPSPPPSPPDQTYDLPAGVACADFDLRIELWADPHRVLREFKDSNGNVVRKLTAGAGNTILFTNLATGDTLIVRTGGSVEHITVNLDGSQTWKVTGHNVVVWIPPDVLGPSTVLYVGNLVFTIAPDGAFTVERFKGRSTDLCAELAS